MFKNFVITNEDKTVGDFSFSWDENVLTITHGLEIGYSATLLDSNDNLVICPMQMSEYRTTISFNTSLEDGEEYRIIFISSQTTEQNADTEFYSGTAEDIMLFCKSLNISQDRLSTVNVTNVEKYQRIVDDAIDGYLCEYYFIPIQAYNQVMPDGSVKKVFPGKIRLIAMQWTAGLILQSEFQNSEPNINEQARNFIEEAKKEMQSMVDYSTRIPGQRRKHPCPTMPPNLAPSKTNEFIL